MASSPIPFPSSSKRWSWVNFKGANPHKSPHFLMNWVYYQFSDKPLLREWSFPHINIYHSRGVDSKNPICVRVFWFKSWLRLYLYGICMTITHGVRFQMNVDVVYYTIELSSYLFWKWFVQNWDIESGSSSATGKRSWVYMVVLFQWRDLVKSW